LKCTAAGRRLSILAPLRTSCNIFQAEPFPRLTFTIRSIQAISLQRSECSKNANENKLYVFLSIRFLRNTIYNRGKICRLPISKDPQRHFRLPVFENYPQLGPARLSPTSSKVRLRVQLSHARHRISTSQNCQGIGGHTA
jgi:hypothetical protein